ASAPEVISAIGVNCCLRGESPWIGDFRSPYPTRAIVRNRPGVRRAVHPGSRRCAMARKRTIDIRQPELSDEMWQKLAPLLPEPEPSPRGGPRPVPNRPVVEGILWVLRNGGRWKALPQGYPSPSTCWRRLADWEERGVR